MSEAIEQLRDALGKYPPRPLGEKPPNFDVLISGALLEIADRLEHIEKYGLPKRRRLIVRQPRVLGDE